MPVDFGAFKCAPVCRAGQIPGQLLHFGLADMATCSSEAVVSYHMLPCQWVMWKIYQHSVYPVACCKPLKSRQNSSHCLDKAHLLRVFRVETAHLHQVR